MSDPGRISSSSSTNFNGFEVNNNIPQNQNKEVNNVDPGNAGKIIADSKTGAEQAIRNSSFDPNATFDSINKDYKTAINNLNIRKASSSIASTIGRFFLRVVNFVFGRSKESTTLDTQSKIEEMREKKPMSLVRNSEKPVEFKTHLSNEMYGKLTGFGKNVKIEKFRGLITNGTPSEKMNSALFPDTQSPKLSDIKQDPNLQDCWFLSSIGAVLTSQGTEAITRLFTPSEKDGFVNVRLGNNMYEVPMGRICSEDGKDKFGSDSAPWVIALENAMLTHLSLEKENTALITNNTAQMIFHNSIDGINALLGSSSNTAYEGISFETRMTMMTPQEAFRHVQDAFNNGGPIVIGHKGSAFSSLFTGVSPGHAVTVLNVVEDQRNPSKSAVTILDPYGQVKVLNPSDLTKCMMYSLKPEVLESVKNGVQFVESPKVEVDTKIIEEIDTEKDDF